jgi:hypothetical protein
MFEALEGRLTWERKGQSIRIAIPVRPGPFAGIYVPLIVIWLVLATIRYWHVLSEPRQETTEFILQIVAIGIYVVGFFLFLGWIAWTWTGETMVFLNPAEIKIERRVLGIDLAARTFPTNQVSRLKFIPPSRVATQQSTLNPNSTRIQYQADSRTLSFGKGVTEAEARALIDKMLEVYRFPGSWY